MVAQFRRMAHDIKVGPSPSSFSCLTSLSTVTLFLPVCLLSESKVNMPLFDHAAATQHHSDDLNRQIGALEGSVRIYRVRVQNLSQRAQRLWQHIRALREALITIQTRSQLEAFRTFVRDLTEELRRFERRALFLQQQVLVLQRQRRRLQEVCNLNHLRHVSG